jgi:uncharacterized membrane protein
MTRTLTPLLALLVACAPTGDGLDDTADTESEELLPHCVPDSYLLEPLPVPDRTIQATAWAINRRGEVAGEMWLYSGARHGVVWTGGWYFDLEEDIQIDAGNSVAYDLNGEGSVVGAARYRYQPNWPAPVGLEWTEGGGYPVTDLGPEMSEVWTVDDSGRIAGALGTEAFVTRDDGSLQFLGVDVNARGASIGKLLTSSNAGHVAGGALESDVMLRAFVWTEDDGVQYLPRPGSAWLSDVRGINDDGVAVGLVWNPDGTVLSVLWTDDEMLELRPLPGGTIGNAYAINNHDEVVGADGLEDGAHAWIWRHGITTDLNDLVDAPEWHLALAYGINDSGQIVADAYDAEDRRLPVRLTPVCD